MLYQNFAIILEAAEIFIIVVTGRLRDEARLRRGRLRSNSFSNGARERESASKHHIAEKRDSNDN